MATHTTPLGLDNCSMGRLCPVMSGFDLGNGTTLSRLFYFGSHMSELALVTLFFLSPTVNTSEPLFEFEFDRNCNGKCFSMINNSTFLLESFVMYFPKNSFRFNSSFESKMILKVSDRVGVLNVDPKSIKILVKHDSNILQIADFIDGLEFDMNEMQLFNTEFITIQIVTDREPTEKQIQMGKYATLSYRSSFMLSVNHFPDRVMRVEFTQPKIPVNFMLNQYRTNNMNFNSNSNGNNGEYVFLDAVSFTFETVNDSLTIPDYISLMSIQYIFQTLNSTRTDIYGKQVELSFDYGSNLLVAKQFKGIFLKDSYSQRSTNTSDLLEFTLNPIQNQTVWSIMGHLKTNPTPSPIIHMVTEHINGSISVGENIYFSIPLSNKRKMLMEGNFNSISKSDTITLEIYVQDDLYNSITLPTPSSYSEKFTLKPNPEKRAFHLPISPSTKNLAFLFQCTSTNPSEKCSFEFEVYSPSPLSDLVVPLSVSMGCIGVLLVLGVIISVTVIYCRIFKNKTYVNLN